MPVALVPLDRERIRAAVPENVRIVLLVALTFVTGAVDAVSYIGLDRVFTANMTGNVALLGFAVGGADNLPLVRSIVALLGFVAGAALGGRLVRRADPSITWPMRIVGALVLSTALILVNFVTWIGSKEPPQLEVAAALLAVAMGVQGAATRKLGVADLPTTVVTSTLTGLAADSFLGGGDGIRWRRRAAAVLALVIGAVTGGLLVRVSPALGLVPALVVLTGVVAVVLVSGLHVPAPRTDPQG